MEEKIILASGSARRKAMLEMYGIPFEVIPSGMTEFFAEGSGQFRALDMAKKKAFMVSFRNPGRWVLGADTMVKVGKIYLGKPRDEEDAVRMLKMLSGRHHYVFTGVCLRSPEGREFYECDITRVFFLRLKEETIRRYVATGEPMGKAGAYALQGMASLFISQINGSHTNVMGLPLSTLTQLFWQAGFKIPFQKPQWLETWDGEDDRYGEKK